MAEFNDLAEKLNNAHVTEPDKSISLLSNDAEKLKEKEQDSPKDDKNNIAPDVKVSYSVADNASKDETTVSTSSANPNLSHPYHVHVLKEKGDVEIEETAIETASDTKVSYSVADNASKDETTVSTSSANPNLSHPCNVHVLKEGDVGIEETAIETASDTRELPEQLRIESEIGSILIAIRNNLTSEGNTSSVVRETILWKLVLKAREKILTILTNLQDHRIKLLKQKNNLVTIKIGMLQSFIDVMDSVQPKDLPDDLPKVIEETHSELSYHKEVSAICKSVLVAFAENIERNFEHINAPTTVLEQHKAYFSMLQGMSSNRFHLESAIEASKEFENSMKNCTEISTEDPLRRLDLLIDAIDKAINVCTELSSFGNILKQLFDCIEFCVRINDK